MILLKDILYKVSIRATSGDMEAAISGVQFDSRKVEPGNLFVAVKGTQVDGHDFITTAIEKGAIAILAETDPQQIDSLTWISTDSSSAALGIVACNFYGNPSAQLALVGVTGTNGKTTIATLLHQLFRTLGYNSGLLSTICNKINETELSASHTTGDALQINKLLRQMVDSGCTHCFMEASSHAIDQNRIAGLKFAGAIFTNITHDHLDYHLTFAGYIRAKKKFFDQLPSSAFALVNLDDSNGPVMLQNTRAKKYKYSVRAVADFRAKIISDSMQGLELEINNQKVWFSLIGKFNAYNVIAVYGAATLLGEDPESVLLALSSMKPVNGRFERVLLKSKKIAIVDYAHTPDALKNVLNTIKNARTSSEQVITVLGCGGNRDREKRPIMADIACKFSDRVIFTSDNPRNEEPEAIIEEMKAGVSPVDFRKTITIVDRYEALKTALAMAMDGDIILVAGKGHEEYQEIKGVKRDFSDRKILVELDQLMYNNKPGKQ